MKSNLLDEMLYADDCDFMRELEQKKERVYQKAMTILTNKNLLVNEDKTENTTIKRKETETEEEWRNVIKLASKLGNREDIKRRKDCYVKQRNCMENEMENKAKDKATLV